MGWLAELQKAKDRLTEEQRLFLKKKNEASKVLTAMLEVYKLGGTKADVEESKLKAKWG